MLLLFASRKSQQKRFQLNIVILTEILNLIIFQPSFHVTLFVNEVGC